MLEAGKRKGRIIMAYDLRFVHLGITIQHLQNHITIFGFSIAFYGIIIGIGMLLGITRQGAASERIRYMILRSLASLSG